MMSTSISLIQHGSGTLDQCNHSRERKDIMIRNGDVKALMLAEDMILYIEDPKGHIRKLVDARIGGTHL